ncbi:hypothetical protein [Tenacibaculum amylolyticum]|uniref:hypothetical protein n=1 Tax=Tenacibaculum amylolyticum TaxID=104269 RepID=UPI0038B4E5B5
MYEVYKNEGFVCSTGGRDKPFVPEDDTDNGNGNPKPGGQGATTSSQGDDDDDIK